MTDEQLARLIADDDLGLLAVRPKRTPQSSEEERLIEGFQEIAAFVESTGVAPTERGPGSERSLHARLQAIRKNESLRARLAPFDEFGLLSIGTARPEESAPGSIEELLDDPFVDGLDGVASDIFDLRHVPRQKEAESPDYVAQRKACPDFDQYEATFVECQAELRSGRRKLLPFANEQQIEPGRFYVLRGILLLVAEIGERAEKNGKWNARTRCVFENGTESDMLLRSLASELYKDGRRVTQLDERTLDGMLVTGEDREAGHIYVLRSMSEDPAVKAVPNLYKVGLARESIEGRLRNAAKESTYLYAPVELVRSYRCYNLNLAKMENLLHRFFAEAAARVQVRDSEGSYFTPKEWFSVPLPVIETAVRLLVSGEIVNYEYDAKAENVRLRD